MTHDHAPSHDPGRTELGRLARVGNAPFLAIIAVYQWTLSPIVGRQCRYHPTCSRYAQGAYRLHGPVRGSLLTCRRILRCHPFARGGYDPVPLPLDTPDRAPRPATPTTTRPVRSDP